jgi:hypothetical protein
VRAESLVIGAGEIGREDAAGWGLGVWLHGWMLPF